MVQNHNQALGRLPKPTDDRLQSITGTTVVTWPECRRRRGRESAPREGSPSVPASSQSAGRAP